MKRTLLFVGLGAAFLVVSGWVWLSRGRSAKALRTKYRLGGLLLTLTGAAATGCTPPSGTCYDVSTCYDPIPPQPQVSVEDSLSTEKALEVRNGEEIHFGTEYISYVAAVITTPEGEELQRTAFKADGELSLKIEVGDYHGLALLDFYLCEIKEDQSIQLLDRINELPYLLTLVE